MRLFPVTVGAQDMTLINFSFDFTPLSSSPSHSANIGDFILGVYVVKIEHCGYEVANPATSVPFAPSSELYLIYSLS